MTAVSCEVPCLDQARGYAGGEQCPVPVIMILLDDPASIRTLEDCAEGLLHQLESVPIASRGHGITARAVGLVVLWPRANALDELWGDGIAFNGKRVIGVARV